MTAIWLLSTRGRPREAQETIDACMDAGMTSPGVVYIDETVRQYRGKLKLPKNWAAHYEPKWKSLQGSLSWCFKNYPDATQYGWLADDVRPHTPAWDKHLEEAAGDWCLSYARDLWLSESPFERGELEDGTNLSSGLCWGGELVRAVGWWALPGVRQAGIDTAWCKIISPLGLGRYMDNVTVEHLNYRTGKRERDHVDDWERDGDNYIERDIRIASNWVWTAEYRDILVRVGKAAKATPTRRQIDRLAGAVKDSYANEHWKLGQSAARLVRVLEEAEIPSEEILTQILGYHPNEEPPQLD